MRLFRVKGYNAFWFGGLKHFTEEEHYLPGLELPSIMRTFRLIKKGTPCYGVFFWKEDEKDIFIPVPADVVGERKKGRFEKGDLKISYYSEESCVPEIDEKEKAYEPLDRYFISSENLKTAWAEGREKDLKVIPADELFASENRVGLKLNKNTMTGEIGRLYFHDRMRLQSGVSICFLAEELDTSRGEFFGGERNPAEVEEVNRLPEGFSGLVKPREIKKGKRYKFYILTHTFVKGGLLKNRDSGKKLTLEDRDKNKVEFELLWVFSKGSELVSGWRRPALEMLKPGTVLVLVACEDSKDFGSLCQIRSSPQVLYIDWEDGEEKVLDDKTFFKRGWNSGILVEDKKGGEKDEEGPLLP